MANILNLALKKEVFENLKNNVSNEILIDKSNWWRKRLMDLDTGRFKDFDTARVSCGSANKVDYPIEKISLKGDQYSIVVTLPVNTAELTNSIGEVADKNGEQYFDQEKKEELIKQVEENEEIINEATDQTEKQMFTIPIVEDTENYIGKQVLEEELKKYEEDTKPETIQGKVINLLNEFCNKSDVYVVNYPQVMIRPNGQIVSTTQKVGGRRDYDTMIPFNNEDFVKLSWMTDDDFLKIIKARMDELISGNYVFINKNRCSFSKVVSGEDMFTMRVVARKKYMMNRR